MSKKRAEITVIVDVDDNGKHFISIGHPPEQKTIGIRDSAHMLMSGINMLVKVSAKVDAGIKEHELLEELIEHMTAEFGSSEGFNDLMIHDRIKKNKEDDGGI